MTSLNLFRMKPDLMLRGSPLRNKFKITKDLIEHIKTKVLLKLYVKKMEKMVMEQTRLV